MAIVQKNLVTEGLRGRVGNLIFRIRGKTTMTYHYTKRKAPLSKDQVDAQIRFAEAVRKARAALADPAEKKKFKKMAKREGKASAYGAAVSYFMLQKD
jgi:hypothetical protein